MMPQAQLMEVVEAAFRVCEDGVRRWRDLDIAEWLGLERLRDIRAVIERNRSELERHGSLRLVTANPEEQGGRPGSEYWLRFEQAMVICTQSRTPRAEDVRTVMIQVFTKFVNGEISTLPRMELRALEVAADRIVAPILSEQREFHSKVLVRMDRQDSQIAFVTKEVVDIRRHGIGKRRDFPEAVRNRYIGTVEQFYNGQCPSCRDVLVTNNGKVLAGAQLDHWHHVSKNAAEDGWITCGRCNVQLYLDSGFKESKRNAFGAFQDALKVYDRRALKQQGFEF